LVAVHRPEQQAAVLTRHLGEPVDLGSALDRDAEMGDRLQEPVLLLDVAGDLGRQLAVDEHDHEARALVGDVTLVRQPGPTPPPGAVISPSLARQAVRRPGSGSCRSWMFTSFVYFSWNASVASRSRAGSAMCVSSDWVNVGVTPLERVSVDVMSFVLLSARR